MKAKKKSLREEIEYRLGMYFGLRSGALYVRDEKYGNQDQIMRDLERDISRDIRYLLRKELNIGTSESQDFKDLVIMYKDKLMKL
jgi:hypothetical protein